MKLVYFDHRLYHIIIYIIYNNIADNFISLRVNYFHISYNSFDIICRFFFFYTVMASFYFQLIQIIYYRCHLSLLIFSLVIVNTTVINNHDG